MDRISAITAVIVILITAHFLGYFTLKPVKKYFNSEFFLNLSSIVFGIGIIGLLTAIIGGTIGYSIIGFRIFYSVAVLGICLYWIFNYKKLNLKFNHIKIDLIFILILPVLLYHFISYLLIGLAYPNGSDSFSYLLVAQEYLRKGHFFPMLLEPLKDIMPMQDTTCLFEMVYINLLSISNLIATSLFAKLQFLIAVLITFFISKEMGSKKAAWIVVAIILTAPILAYFASESADNYFIAISFEILCIYFLWLFYKNRDFILLLYSGILAGMMVAAKLTTCYYAVALIIALPFLLNLRLNETKELIDNKNKGKHWRLFNYSLIFMIPVLIICSVFPILIYLKSGQLIYGLNWVPADATVSSWYGPYQKMMFNHYLRYSDIFIKYTEFPYCFAGILSLFKYYTFNPFIVGNIWSLQFFHSPLSLLVILFSLTIIFSRKVEPFYKWLASVIMLGYVAKLINYPFLLPPKSEVFQIVPATILFACVLNNSLTINTNNKKKLNKNNKKLENKQFLNKLTSNNRLLVNLFIVLLLPLIYINAFRVWPMYSYVIDRYSFASKKEVASDFRQQWYNDNLTNKNVVFGRGQNEICYIVKSKAIPFFWESMYFVSWNVIEERMNKLHVDVIYDSSAEPNSIKPSYEKILPVIKKRDHKLYMEINKALLLYEKNYGLKQVYLNNHYKQVTSDGLGLIYVKE
ncbi:hypothetical protein [Syntrophomonas wolfei]|uniref:hypothetical protein n=1 Tax=Syntrophomonas wolfei TaxID=863 RepID=UPI0007746D3D|nr:hypothetical protein [Syntrophomonas wolfei]